MNDASESGRGLATRWPETIVAAVLFALALLVIADSLRVGHGWASDGPRAGYFPFYIGLGLALTSGALLIGQLRRWRRDQRVFVGRTEAAGVWAVLWPMGIYVALIAPLGIYLASIVLIAYFMRRHGRFAWWMTALVAVAVPVVLFLVFERWFTVPLPKGPIERWLGF
ncbi:MAG: tripartite tricarboxylate transporter TctB family protein [Burkholderiales bacterium]|nr:tripartite tricarboxylate transporter TctB family protein [Burkholderiales bacterium]